MVASNRRTGRGARRRGAATVEYALLLALLVGGTLIAAHQLSGVQREAFGQLTDTTGAHSRTVGANRTLARRPPDPPSRVSQVMRYADYRVGVVLLAAGALGLGISWAIRLRRRAANRAVVPDAAPAPAPLQSTIFEKRQLMLRVLSKEQRLSADRIRIRHVMTTETVHIRPQSPLAEIRQLMQHKRLRHVLVCDARDALLGVVSDRDLASRRGKTAADVMSAHPVTVSPESLVVPAITWMINQHISCLPVVADNRVVGVVTTTDLLLTLQCSLQLLEQIPEEPHPDESAAALGAAAGC